MSETNQKSLSMYISGLIFSFLLVLAAYVMVSNHWLEGMQSVIALIVLAVLQLLVQLYFFLHIGQAANGRSNLTATVITLSIVFIVVAGSLWIMRHLNYNMDPMQVNEHLLKLEGFQK